MTFNLQVELPRHWDAVSQGERIQHIKNEDKTLVQWESPEPQDEIFLVASRFTEYLRHTGKVTSMVFLRTPDEDLANKYLEATSRYIAMYDKLIGPYPYKKFALVENFWETGFGMPSFTLLGPTVIRLPFIINSSYPHEILHNWWGNSVFPEYSQGKLVGRSDSLSLGPSHQRSSRELPQSTVRRLSRSMRIMCSVTGTFPSLNFGHAIAPLPRR